MKHKISLSVAIITLNEEDRLPACLESLTFADEVIVVDSGSTDRTVEIARSAGCKVYEEAWKGFGPQKQSAVDKCNHEWVLIIDADERVPEETRAEIISVLNRPDADGYSFPRKNIYNGKWIRSCGWWPDRVVRLFRKEQGKVKEAQVHEAVIVSGTTRPLDKPLIHYPVRNLEHVISKINNYSSLGASMLFEKGHTATSFRAFFRGAAAFLKYYILKRGMFDGYEGFVLSFSHGINTCFKYLKLREKRINS